MWLASGSKVRRPDGVRGRGAASDIHEGFLALACCLICHGLDAALLIHSVRASKLPAIGAISLLGAWLVTRMPGRAWLAGLTSTAVIAALFGVGVWVFHAMYAAFGVPLGG
jgi:hypothetical protein